MDDVRPDDADPVDAAAGDEHAMPRWVKGFAIAGVVVAVLVVVVLLLGRGAHGPSRHQLGSGPPPLEAALR